MGYDPFAPETLADPFPAYDELRRECPVHHHAGFGERGFYTLSRYDDVVGLFKDLDRWSADWGQAPIYVKEGGLKSDPPEHTIYRRLVTGAFTARRGGAPAPPLEQAAHEVIHGVAGDGTAHPCAALPLP